MQTTKPVPVGNICDQLATLAQSHGLKTLAMWLKMAANESYLSQLMTEAKTDGRIGVWDWDVTEDKTYTNAVGGEFFAKRPEDAAKGVPLEKYVGLVHPHDLASFSANLDRALKSGGAFSAEYRVIAGDVTRWIQADGNCVLDASGRPVRMIGSMIDISGQKRAAAAAPAHREERWRPFSLG